MTNAIESRQEVLALLRDIRSHYASYHNHKEASAWGGIVLYAVLWSQLFKVANTSSCGLKIAMTIGILLATGITGYFLKKQFYLIYKGASYVAASFFLESDVTSKPNEELNLGIYSPPSKEQRSRTKSNYVLPTILQEKADELNPYGGAFRSAIEKSGYSLLALLLLSGILLTWI
jgi:hypothetical protein